MQFFTRIAHNCPIRYDSTQKRLRQSKYNRVDFLPIDYSNFSEMLKGRGTIFRVYLRPLPMVV